MHDVEALVGICQPTSLKKGEKMRRTKTRTNIANLGIKCFVTAIAIFGVAATCQTQAKKENPIVAVVTDKDGQSTTVTGLLAYYRYSESIGITNMLGQVTGTAYKEHGSEFPTLSMRITEGHITFNEDVPFREIKRLETTDWGDASVYPPKRLLIEKRDGSTYLISYDEKSKLATFEERDSQNAVKRQFKIARFQFEMSDDHSALDVFTGRAKTSGGKEGEFRIFHLDVRTIVFQ